MENRRFRWKNLASPHSIEITVNATKARRCKVQAKQSFDLLCCHSHVKHYYAHRELATVNHYYLSSHTSVTSEHFSVQQEQFVRGQ